MNTQIIFVSAIVLASLGILTSYYRSLGPAETLAVYSTSHSKGKVPLYIYESVGASSRKWNTFYDRVHQEPKSDFLQLCDNTHSKHHMIGNIQSITDDDLRKLYSKQDISLQHHRILRDILLLKLVSETGGIVIPRNTFLMENTQLLYSQARESGVILYGGTGNLEFGCPVIVSTGMCAGFADVLLKEYHNNSLRGGVLFGGGLPTMLDRSKKYDTRIASLSGIREMDTHELLGMGEYTGRDLVIRVPFPQESGTTSIPKRDAWIYATTMEDLLLNPTILRDIVNKSCGGKIVRVIKSEDVE